jgi:hypothetical protein
MTERAPFRPVFEQRYRHADDHARSTVGSPAFPAVAQDLSVRARTSGLLSALFDGLPEAHAGDVGLALGGRVE